MTYLARVPTEGADMVLHPFQTRELIFESEVKQATLCRLDTLRKSERSEAVVDTDVHDGCALSIAHDLVNKCK